MSPHLSSEDVTRWMLGDRSVGVQQHVGTCSECQVKVAAETEALLQFRGSVRAWSDDELSSMRGRDWRAAGQSRIRFRNACLAFAMCLLAFVAVISRRSSTGSGSGSPADAVLLTRVNSELSREVPSPMEPLMKLVSRESGSPAGDRN